VIFPPVPVRSAKDLRLEPLTPAPLQDEKTSATATARQAALARVELRMFMAIASLRFRERDSGSA